MAKKDYYGATAWIHDWWHDHFKIKKNQNNDVHYKDKIAKLNEFLMTIFKWREKNEKIYLKNKIATSIPTISRLLK